MKQEEAVIIRIKAILEKEFEVDIANNELSHDLNLHQKGVISSLDMNELVEYIEKEWK